MGRRFLTHFNCFRFIVDGFVSDGSHEGISTSRRDELFELDFFFSEPQQLVEVSCTHY